jgi:hypothetical protein
MASSHELMDDSVRRQNNAAEPSGIDATLVGILYKPETVRPDRGLKYLILIARLKMGRTRHLSLKYSY